MTETLRALLASKLDDPDPVVRAHAAARLAGAPAPGAEASRPLAESVRLMQLAATCPYRSTSRSCGCFACALDVEGDGRRRPEECWACVETYGVG